MAYRSGPKPEPIDTWAITLCRRIDRKTHLWLPAMLALTWWLDVTAVFMWATIARMAIWPLVGLNPITCRLRRRRPEAT